LFRKKSHFFPALIKIWIKLFKKKIIVRKITVKKNIFVIPSLKFVFFLVCSASFALPMASVYASDPAIVEQAQTLCLEKAKAQGYELKSVLYSGASDVPGKDAKIVLQLTKEGKVAKLTCNYDKKSGGVDFGDVGAVASPSIPWWGFLLPLLGLLALWFLAKNKNETRTYGNYYEADIRGGEGAIPVYEHPSLASPVISSVHNGERIRVSDRDIATANDGWVHLARGGWVEKQYVGTPSR
jgi:hypothetical protein